MQINPNENIPLIYLIADTSDANTYYAKAVVRNSLTGGILDTILLTQDAGNSRRFYGSTTAPGHSGPGALYIDITITPYTDANYTVIASAYPEYITQYQIAFRWNLAFGSGGGVSVPDFNWGKFDRVLNDRMAKGLEEIMAKIPAGTPGVDVEGLRSGIMEDFKSHLKDQERIRKAIRRQKIKESKPDSRLEKMAEGVEELREAKPAMKLPKPVPSPVRIDNDVPEERDLNSALYSFGRTRRPSEGIVPEHLVLRNLVHAKKNK